ncbi:MAG: arginine decarboxylase, pyruvoyl-dependent [candidate division Zixibacteria bacterium]
MPIVPKKLFLTKGVGRHKEHLASFELALRSARIAEYNLVHVSSILPPGCKVISRSQGISQLTPGQIVFSVLSRNSTCEPNRMVSASVGLAIPQDKNQYGYLSEHSAFGQNERISGDYAEDLAAGMLASTLGIDFDVDQSYDEKKELWKISGKIVRTTGVTQSAAGDKKGLWTTVLAAAIFITE